MGEEGQRRERDFVLQVSNRNAVPNEVSFWTIRGRNRSDTKVQRSAIK
jgi:hypothetical protein